MLLGTPKPCKKAPVVPPVMNMYAMSTNCIHMHNQDNRRRGSTVVLTEVLINSGIILTEVLINSGIILTFITQTEAVPHQAASASHEGALRAALTTLAFRQVAR